MLDRSTCLRVSTEAKDLKQRYEAGRLVSAKRLGASAVVCLPSELSPLDRCEQTDVRLRNGTMFV